MNNLDLNINNYNLDELLGLFKLKRNYTSEQLKNAKRIVLKLHPDKSKLNSKYFLFFAKAYKIIVKIHNMHKNNKDTEYKTDNDSNEIYLEKLSKDKNFNEIFNKMFDETILNKDDGYGDWLTSNNDIEERTSTSLNEMNKIINEKKENMSAITKKTDISELSYSNDSINDLYNDNIECYSSNIFSDLQYEDLKKAHTETVVPVCESDFNKIKTYTNTDEYKKERANQNIAPLNANQLNEYIRNKELNDNNENMNRTYNLVKEYQIYNDQKKVVLGKLKQIMK